MKNVVEKSKSTLGKINPHYDISVLNVKEIYEKSSSPFDMICTGFRFGYIQGMKAAKAEISRGRV